MRAHAEEHLPQQDIEIWREIVRAIHSLPDIDLGSDESGRKVDLSCHMLARAVGNIWNLRAVDGEFLRGFNHSWVESPNGNIIDVYPVAILGGPFLVDCSVGILKRQMYKELPQKYRDEFTRPKFLCAVRTVTEVLGEIAAAS